MPSPGVAPGGRQLRNVDRLPDHEPGEERAEHPDRERGGATSCDLLRAGEESVQRRIAAAPGRGAPRATTGARRSSAAATPIDSRTNNGSTVKSSRKRGTTAAISITRRRMRVGVAADDVVAVDVDDDVERLGEDLADDALGDVLARHQRGVHERVECLRRRCWRGPCTGSRIPRSPPGSARTPRRRAPHRRRSGRAASPSTNFTRSRRLISPVPSSAGGRTS